MKKVTKDLVSGLAVLSGMFQLVAIFVMCAETGYQERSGEIPEYSSLGALLPLLLFCVVVLYLVKRWGRYSESNYNIIITTLEDGSKITSRKNTNPLWKRVFYWGIYTIFVCSGMMIALYVLSL